MTQQEKPGITPQELNACFKLPLDTPVLVSGGQFEHFREGWAHEIMSDSRVAHWFKRGDFERATALCSQPGAVRWLYGPGNYPRCENCKRVMKRMIRAGAM